MSLTRRSSSLVLPRCAERGWSQRHGISAEPQLEPLSQPAKRQPLTLTSEQQPISGAAEQQPIPFWYALLLSACVCID